MAQNFCASQLISLQKSISGQVGAFEHALKDKIYLIDDVFDNPSLLVWNLLYLALWSNCQLHVGANICFSSTRFYIQFHCI